MPGQTMSTVHFLNIDMYSSLLLKLSNHVFSVLCSVVKVLILELYSVINCLIINSLFVSYWQLVV